MENVEKYLKHIDLKKYWVFALLIQREPLYLVHSFEKKGRKRRERLSYAIQGQQITKHHKTLEALNKELNTIHQIYISHITVTQKRREHGRQVFEFQYKTNDYIIEACKTIIKAQEKADRAKRLNPLHWLKMIIIGKELPANF